MNKTINPARRQFLIQSAGASGGLALGLYFPQMVSAQNTNAEVIPLKTPNEINVWVVIKPNDQCVIRVVRSEMGQGTRTGLMQLVAEELECDWNKVSYETPSPAESLARKRIWGEMHTGGSRGIRISQEYVRKAGAAARMMLMQAAANRWNVPVEELRVDQGVITHASSGKKITYGKVATDAALLTPPDPKTIALKKPQD
jgi:isoquinoline 1-oxidoreductase beta subunit